MKVDIERAMNFVNHLVDIGLIQAIHGENFYPYSWLKNHDPIFNSYCFTDGACKGVFIFQDADWVIKFDYYDFNHSYCARELDNYEATEEAGLAHYFPQTQALCAFEEIHFIIQERCNCGEEEVQEAMFDSLKRRYKEWGDEVNDDDIWDEVIDIETDTALTCMFNDPALNAFAFERHINDLHTGNFGKIGENFVILDFSGYGSGVWGN